MPQPQPASAGTTLASENVAKPRFNVGVTVLVALAVFAIESAWNFYDAQVPPLIQQYVSSAAVIGLIMGMDSVVGVFLAPWAGNRSDRTRTRWGRRMPYLVGVVPVAAVLFVLLPHAPSFPVLLTLIFLFGLTINMLKPIAESLMPDFVRPEHRGRGTAIVKIATSLTIIVSALVSLFLVDHHLYLAFAVPSILMVIAVVVLAVTVHERNSHGYQSALAADDVDGDLDPVVPLRRVLTSIVTSKDRTRLVLIVATFFFIAAWAGSRSLLTPYGTEALDLTRGQAGGLPLFAGFGFILAAYPIALIADRYGRVRTIRSGVLIFVLAMAIAELVPTRGITTGALIVAAIGYAAFVINAVVLWWELAPTDGLLGTYTGIWTATFSLAGTLGPAMVGAMVDLTSWSWMLAEAGLLAGLALVLLFVLRRSAFVHPQRTSVATSEGNR